MGQGKLVIAALAIALAFTLSPGAQAACGDLNDDGDVNPIDLADLVNYVFFNVLPEAPSAADVNDCGDVDYSDVCYLLEYIYNLGPYPCTATGSCSPDPDDFRVYIDYPDEVVLPQSGGEVEVPVYIAFDEWVFGYSLGIEYSEGPYELDSVDFTSGLIAFAPATDTTDLVANRTMAFTYQQGLHGPDSGLAFTLVFEVEAFTEPFTLDLDTVSLSEHLTSVFSPAYRGSPHPLLFELGEMTVIPYFFGDADGDGLANITDAVFVIAYIFNNGAEPDPYLAGDANCDGLVNVTDAVYLISYIFNDGPAPGEDC